MKGSKKESKDTLRSLQRGLLVIDHLAKNGSSTLAELRISTGLSNPTLFRILNTLCDRGWVRRQLYDGRYELPYSRGQAMKVASHGHPFTELSAPVLEDLQQQTRWPSDIAISSGLGRLEVIESTRFIGTDFPHRVVYGSTPSLAFTALGRAYLASCSCEEQTAHLQFLERRGSVAERNFLKSGAIATVLAQVRHNGYAIQQDDYWAEPVDAGPPIRAIAMPLKDSCRVFGAISIVWRADDLTYEDAPAKLLPHLQIAASTLATMAGCLSRTLGDTNT